MPSLIAALGGTGKMPVPPVPEMRVITTGDLYPVATGLRAGHWAGRDACPYRTTPKQSSLIRYRIYEVEYSDRGRYKRRCQRLSPIL